MVNQSLEISEEILQQQYDKQVLRKEIRQLKSQHQQEELYALSLLVTHQLLRHPRLLAADNVVLYYSLPDEVDTHDTVNRLVNMGKKVLLPAVVSDTEMELREYRDENDLKEGAFYIMEPCGQRFEQYENIQLLIAPGVAFTADGARLGRGKGYYDRMLSKLPNAYRIGVCFPFQLVDSIPCTPFDIKMNEVITAL